MSDDRQAGLREGCGHRTPDPHDCFLMNCHGLGPELAKLRERYIAAVNVDRMARALRLWSSGFSERQPFEFYVAGAEAIIEDLSS